MAKKKLTPTALRETAGGSITVQYKDSVISLSPLQYSLFILLSNGKRYSSHKIMQLIHTSDPRKEVQYLRRKGVDVLDVWVDATQKIPRHKRYWIDPKKCSNEQD